MFQQTTYWNEVVNTGGLMTCQITQLHFKHFQIYLYSATYIDILSYSIHLSFIYKYLEMWFAPELQLCTVRNLDTLPVLFSLTFRRRIKSRLQFAGIIRRLTYSTRFQDKG